MAEEIRKVCPICGKAFIGKKNVKYDKPECSMIASRRSIDNYQKRNVEERRAYQREYYKTHKAQSAESSNRLQKRDKAYRIEYLKLIKMLGMDDEVYKKHPEFWKQSYKNKY